MSFPHVSAFMLEKALGKKRNQSTQIPGKLDLLKSNKSCVMKNEIPTTCNTWT